MTLRKSSPILAALALFATLSMPLLAQDAGEHDPAALSVTDR